MTRPNLTLEEEKCLRLLRLIASPRRVADLKEIGIDSNAQGTPYSLILRSLHKKGAIKINESNKQCNILI